MSSLEFIRNLLSREQGQGQNYPELPLVQVNEQGGLETDPVKMAQAELGLKQASTPLTITDRLFGRDMEQDYQTINPKTGQAQMATLTNHKPGFFEDFGRGFQENATQGFNVNNLAPVQGKGLATRLGEGLGTLARFYDKPIGRMAVATGLSMLTGETNPLNEGVKAYVGRQTNMTQDRVYRNQLKQLGMTDDEVNAIPGNVTKDVFEGVTSGMRLGNQRMTYGQLAMLDDNIAEEVRKNPALANMFVPISIARDIYGLKRETAQGKMAETKAKTEKTQAETKQVGKPKVTINRREGGTTSTVNITHSGGSGKGANTSNRPTRNNDTGLVRVQAPNGQKGTIPRANLRKAIKAGYKVI